MNVKEIRCNNQRENRSCNNKLLEYEGELIGKIRAYCRKCKCSHEIVDGKIKKKLLS